MITHLHPSQPLRDHFVNDYGKRTRLENCVITGRERGRATAKGRETLLYIVTHQDFPDQEFRVSAHSFKCTIACPNPADVFPVEQRRRVRPRTEAAAVAASENPEENDQRHSVFDEPASVQQHEGRGFGRTEVIELREQGITVDDDNEPLPENVEPDPTPNITPGEWINLRQCIRESSPHNGKLEGRWKNKSWAEISRMSPLQIWLMCMPVDYLENVVIKKLNDVLDVPTDLQEFVTVLGCIHFMACYQGVSDRRDWWSMKPISTKEGAPFRLNEYISWKRFDKITSAMVYTDEPTPTFKDGFHQQRGIQDAFNDHYEKNYEPGWWNCIDESMAIWLNKYCPGFMFVPRKPHPFGNEYHTICDGSLEGDSRPILWRAMIQEGKDRPTELGSKKYDVPGKPTVGLVCRMVEPIKGTGKCVTGDSGFCVSLACVELLRKMGVYSQFLIKKRGRYWPKGVPGDMIDQHFTDKPIGHSETWATTFEGVPFFIHCTKGML